MTKKTKRLTESAMLIAVAVVLELVSKMFIPGLPFGGQFTLASMLPVVLISYRHGMKWGFCASFAYALIEMAIGTKNVAAAFQPDYFGEGVMIANALIMCFFDYVAAFTVLGLGGLFRNKIKNAGAALALGAVVALSARYLCHIASGYILFSSYAEWFFTQEGFPAWGASLVASVNADVLGILYSVVYNGLNMIPEIIITAACALLIARIPKVVTKIS